MRMLLAILMLLATSVRANWLDGNPRYAWLLPAYSQPWGGTGASQKGLEAVTPSKYPLAWTYAASDTLTPEGSALFVSANSMTVASVPWNAPQGVTFTMWVKSSSALTSSSARVDFINAGSVGPYVSYNASTDAKFRVVFYPNVDIVYSPAQGMAADTWYQIGMTGNKTTGRIYVNGREAGSGSSTALPSGTGTITLNFNAAAFRGHMKGLLWYPRCMSAAEMLHRYEQQRRLVEAGL